MSFALYSYNCIYSLLVINVVPFSTYPLNVFNVHITVLILVVKDSFELYMDVVRIHVFCVQ